MITPKDIENKTMSPEKRKSAKNDYFAFYVGRPLSYILTIPFLYNTLPIFENCFLYLAMFPSTPSRRFHRKNINHPAISLDYSKVLFSYRWTSILFSVHYLEYL